MSPTIIRQDGYRIIIYYNDHKPAHVHVKKDKKEARIQLSPVQIIDDYGCKANDLKHMVQLVAENQTYLLDMWQMIHGDSDDTE